MFLWWSMLFLCAAVRGLQITSDPNAVANRSFSYVIVGGGTAGLTVASRLAEIPSLEILVIEAGVDGENNSWITDPANFGIVPIPAEFDWRYNTTPQAGRTFTFTQGKVLGGSSSVNGMGWTRGTIDQYDTIEQLGNPGWNFESFLHYMKKAEIFHLPNPEQVRLGATVTPSVHGFSGRVNAGYPQPFTASQVGQLFITSAQNAITGLKHNPDVCSGDPNGVSTFFFSITPGNGSEPGANRRSSAAEAFVYPDRNVKPNLTILVGHQATRILWDQTTDAAGSAHATGVEFVSTPAPNTDMEDLGERFEVNTEKEVIVSSGTIGSPRLLELSGVGNSRILEMVGIPTKVNLPSIGTNLQDQALNVFGYVPQSSVDPAEITVVNAPATLAVGYLDLSQALGEEAASVAGKMLLDSVNERAKRIVQEGGFTNVRGMEKMLMSQALSITERNAPVVELIAGSFNAGNGSIFLIPDYWSLLTQWRGTTHITSSNPSVYPAVNPNYFSDSLNWDLNIQSNATKLARKIFTTPPFSSIVGEEVILTSPLPPLNASDKKFKEFVKGTYGPVLHFVGSMAMLPREDGGVVDNELVVYGTGNVRVVDASILPIQLSAHLSSTVYGIAEKAADIIKSHL